MEGQVQHLNWFVDHTLRLPNPYMGGGMWICMMVIYSGFLLSCLPSRKEEGREAHRHPCWDIQHVQARFTSTKWLLYFMPEEQALLRLVKGSPHEEKNNRLSHLKNGGWLRQGVQKSHHWVKIYYRQKRDDTFKTVGKYKEKRSLDKFPHFKW